MILTEFFLHGAILALCASAWLILTLLVNARIFLHDYPENIQRKVPPKTESEKMLSYVLGIPFILILLSVPLISTISMKQASGAAFWALWLNAAGIEWVFNLFDLLVLDWLLFCTITPHFLVVPGSHPEDYKDYKFHFLGFLKGTVFSVVGGLVIAGVVGLV